MQCNMPGQCVQACQNVTTIPQSFNKFVWNLEKYELVCPKISEYIMVCTGTYQEDKSNGLKIFFHFWLQDTIYYAWEMYACIFKHKTIWRKCAFLGVPWFTISQDEKCHPGISDDIPGYPFSSRWSGFQMCILSDGSHIMHIIRLICILCMLFWKLFVYFAYCFG